MDTGTVFAIPALAGPSAERLMPPSEAAALRAENRHLRGLLSQTTRQIKTETDLLAIEAARLHAAVEASAARGRCDRADAAARFPDAGAPDARSRASEAFTHRVLWNTTDCVKLLDLDGRLVTVGENCPSVYGVADAADLLDRPWADLWPGTESRLAILGALTEARAGRPCRFQAALETEPEAGATWWDIAVTPIDGADGRPERILAVLRDITELKRNETRQTLLMQELAHRVKNTLAMVQAIAAQTLRNAPSLDAAGEALGARLLALAQAHDVLMQGSWSSAALSGLVAGAVTLHSDGVPGRFRVGGPEVTLDARAGLTLALMLHELGTNAAKYGALSTPEGHVVIDWAVEGLDGSARLRLRWEEIGGPPVVPPTRTGFGTRLIARSLAHSFGGEVTLTFPETGAVLILTAPLASVTAA